MKDMKGHEEFAMKDPADTAETAMNALACPGAQWQADCTSPAGMNRVFRTPLAWKVIGCAIAVHKALGPGMLESTYDDCMALEFEFVGLPFARQVRAPIVYRGVALPRAYRVDFLIDASLVLELKAVECLMPVHDAQVLTYLKLLKLRQGLLINFNVTRLVDGLRSFLLGDAEDGVMKDHEGHEGP